MLLGRFAYVVPVLALAGSLALPPATAAQLRAVVDAGGFTWEEDSAAAEKAIF